VATPLATPVELTVATDVAADAHVTSLVRSRVESSENVPMAVKASVSPFGRLGLAGVTAIDSRVTLLPVSTVDPLTPSSVAEIVVVPGPTPVARPVAVIVATAVVPDVQVAALVRFSVEPSEKAPIAVNCSVVPLTILGFAGVTTIVCKTAGLTVSTVEPEVPPKVALIVDVPVASPVATPAAVIVTTDFVSEDQVT
jgi:hypothetical protein